MDYFQKIMDYYPKKDMSSPNISTLNVFYFLRRGWGEDLIERLKKNSLSIVSTFFTPAFMAEYHHYKGKIYCVICDADISRSWVNLAPKESKIIYLAPCTWVENRLKLYGIKKENIILTGYPLPKENIGRNMEIVREDLKYRLVNLDPKKRYRKVYEPLIHNYLGELPKKSNHPLTIMFSVGGAGAQKEICLQALNSLAKKIREKKLRFIIGLGVREELKDYFKKNLKDLQLDGWAHVISAIHVNEYFKIFNEALRETDILWTKPSELSFYSGLGIPIIIAPPIGSQEIFNRKWLWHTGVGITQENPKYAHEWIFDMLDAGDFAEAAVQGFMEVEKMGTYNIEKIIQKSYA